MELPASTSFRSVSCVSLCPVSSRRVFVYRFVFHGVKLSRKLHCSNPKRSLRITVNPENNGEDKDNTAAGANFFEESGFVEVIAIGSRKDAVVDFCLDSPFQLSSSLLLRFWYCISFYYFLFVLLCSLAFWFYGRRLVAKYGCELKRRDVQFTCLFVCLFMDYYISVLIEVKRQIFLAGIFTRKSH